MTHTIAGHGCAVHLGELVRMRAGDHGINRHMTGGLLVRPAIELSDQAWRARLNVSSANLNKERLAGARDAKVQAGDHADLQRNSVPWVNDDDACGARNPAFVPSNVPTRLGGLTGCRSLILAMNAAEAAFQRGTIMADLPPWAALLWGTTPVTPMEAGRT